MGHVCSATLATLGLVFSTSASRATSESASSSSAPPTPAAALCLTGHLRAATVDPERLFVQPLRDVFIKQFAEAGFILDVFAVTDAGEECLAVERALRPLGLRRLACIPAVEPDEERRSSEELWLREGPRTGRSREAFLGQMKKVAVCESLVQSTGVDYQLIARARMDVRWHKFPKDVRSLELPGVVWLPWRSSEALGQYMNDLFAIGRPREMIPYLRAYHELLDQSRWPVHRAFDSSSDALDTEELWEVTLLNAGVLARHHREICFNLLSKDIEAVAARSTDAEAEVEDNCRCEPLAASRHPNGFSLDEGWQRLPLGSLPGQFEHDGLLTARLMHLWLAEWARLGRPAKVLDLGCGRATMLERWLQFYPASLVGVDMLPGLRTILGDDLLELDLGTPIFPSSFGRPRGCRLLSPQGEAQLRSPGAMQKLMACCYDARCLGIGQHDDGSWDFLTELSIMVEGDVLLASRNMSMQGTLPWVDGRGDWAVVLDVAGWMPSSAQDTLWANVERMVSQGVVLCESHFAQGTLEPHPLESLGFVQDTRAEELLQPFAATRGVRPNCWLRVFRRQEVMASGGGSGGWPMEDPTPCNLKQLFEWSPTQKQCKFGITFGCLDAGHIWVADGCNGWFARGSNEGGCLSDAGPRGSARSNWSFSPASWQYVECILPEDEIRQPSSLATVTLEVCTNNIDSENALLKLHMHDGYWLSEPFIAAGEALVGLRLDFDAVAQLLEATTLEAFTKATPSPARVCLAWKLWGASGRPMRLKVWKQGEDTEPLMPDYVLDSWAAAQALSRMLDNKDGIFGIYDTLDPFAGWGDRDGLWRSIAQEDAAADLEVQTIQALRRVDGFAAFLSALRVVANMVAEQPSREDVQKANLFLSRMGQPWSDWGEQLLAVATGLGDHSEALGGSHHSVYLRREHGNFLHLHFRDNPLGRYMYHVATQAQ